MCLLRRPLIRPQVIGARGREPLVSQDLLDVRDGTAVEEERGRHGVPQDMRGDFFPEVKTHSLPEPAEERDRRSARHGPAARTDKERVRFVAAMIHIFFDPVERAGRKEHHPLFVALADDTGLPGLEIH